MPALVRTSEDSDRIKLELAIIENLQREDINAVDRARAFDRLIKEFGMKHVQVAEKIGKSLGEKVKEVRVTHRLTDSPACLVADEHDMNANLARLLKSAVQKAPNSKPILEINPKHPVVLRLKIEEKRFDDWASVLFDQALLAEGGQLDDPASFVKRVNQLMLEMSSS